MQRLSVLFTSLAHLCCVIKPCEAGIKFSSPPLKRNIILCFKIRSDLEITRSISNIMAQPAPSSLPPKKYHPFKFTRKDFHVKRYNPIISEIADATLSQNLSRKHFLSYL